MGLKRKILGFVVAIATWSALALYFITDSSIRRHLEGLEDAEVQEKTLIVNRLLEASLIQFDYWAAEYYQWDEVYQAAKEARPGALRRNFSPDSFEIPAEPGFSQTVVPTKLFLFRQNQLLEYIGMSSDGKSIEHRPPAELLTLAQSITKDSHSQSDSRTGFVMWNGESYAYVSSGVFPTSRQARSSRDASASGTLLVLRRYSRAEIDDLAGLTAIPFSWQQGKIDSLSSSRDPDGQMIHTLLPVQTLGGEGFHIKVSLPRSAFRIGISSMRILLILMIMLSVTTIAALTYLFDLLVIRRILSIHSVLGEAQQNKRAIEKIADPAQDEIATLGREVRRIFEALVFIADRDSLTGLPNRRAFFESVQELLRKNLPGVYGAVILDLDKFKSINDTYGHPQGDAVLRSLASHLKPLLGIDCCVGRLGGEEFALFLKAESPEAITEKIENIRKAVESTEVPLLESKGSVRVTLSAGVATQDRTTGAEPLEIDMLMSQADSVLYEAKGQGRNRVCRFRAAEKKRAA